MLKIFKYLKGNQNYGLRFRKGLDLNVYTDSDFAGDKTTRKSTTEYIILVGSTPTTWYSKLQKCISISTTWSEYYAIDECSRHRLWYENILGELNIKCDCIVINIDSKAFIFNSENETINQKSRLKDIRYHHIRELIKEN